MRICFVQPNNIYQVISNRMSFSLTFPQMICNLELEEDSYCVFVDGRMENSFEEFLIKNRITHVLITCITSTFSRAVYLAKCAHEIGCITVLGGIFATLAGDIILRQYNCFDYIIKGGINKDVLIHINKRSESTRLIEIPREDNFNMPLGSIMLNPSFTSIFGSDQQVCYELGCGCIHNCSFCTLRKAFGRNYRPRIRSIIQNDIGLLSTRWSKLKLIDDDIYLSCKTLEQLDFSGYREIVIEARINHLTDSFLKICKSKGVTHIITGIESFSETALSKMDKSNGIDWNQHIREAIELCNKYSINLRPVLMINPPFSSKKDMFDLIQKTKDWTPENHVELLLSLYTPHPGMPHTPGILLTNNLSLFDHLHLVFLPTSMKDVDPAEVLFVYEQIVSQTNSREFNPYIEVTNEHIEEFVPFFRDYY